MYICLKLNNTRFLFKTVILMLSFEIRKEYLIINRNDNCREKNCNF